MPAPDPSGVDPNAWADAILKLFAGGGWVIPVLIALAIIANAWAKRGKAKSE